MNPQPRGRWLILLALPLLAVGCSKDNRAPTDSAAIERGIDRSVADVQAATAAANARARQHPAPNEAADGR